MGGAHDAGEMIDLATLGKVEDHRKTLQPAAVVQLEVGKIVEELHPVRQAADRIDASDGMLELDLRHHHGGEVLQAGKLLLRRRARLGSEHAERTQPMPFTRHQRRTGVKAYAAFAENAVPIAIVLRHIGDDQQFRSLGNLGAGRTIPGNGTVIDTDAGFEPLPIDICQRHCGDREIEDLARHAGDAIETFAGRRVEKAKTVERLQALMLCEICHMQSFQADVLALPYTT